MSKRSITLPLLRKRSEHNEGLVSTLEELALHQEELQCIGPILGRTCGKTLKILLLQNNVIERLVVSELRYFKVLEYLNLALNNIRLIEGLRGMECLKKLDLTLNFISMENLEKSVDDLAECPVLEELFLIGNPCMGVDVDGTTANEGAGGDAAPSKSIAGWSGCRQYIIARLQNLRYLDGREVKRSERIVAMQKLPMLTKELRNLTASRLEQQHPSSKEDEPSIDEAIEIDNDEQPTQHNPETRTKISNEMYAQKQSKEKQETAHLVPQKGEKDWEEEHNTTVKQVRQREEQTRSRSSDFKANGEIKQCNQGKWKFWFEESDNTSSGKCDILTMTIVLPKHLSTSLIDVDIHPTYVSVVIKSKILRVILPVEIISDQSKAKRIASSGHLELSMPKCNPGEVVVGMPHVRSRSSGKNGGSVNSQNNTLTGIQNGTKRERLGCTLLREAITAESIGGIVPRAYDDYEGDLVEDDDDDEPPPLF